MLEFSGTISEECKLYLLKWHTRVVAFVYLTISIIAEILTVLTVFILDEPIILLFSILFVSLGIFCIFLLLVPHMPSLRKKLLAEMTSKVPVKVSIDNEILTVRYDNEVDDKFGERDFNVPLDSIRKIIDVGGWYHILPGIPVDKKELNCICQKDLIVNGSIEEFEKLFEDKIVRRKKQ